MKTFGFKRLAGLLAAATLVGAPLAFPAFAQDADPPAVEAAAPAPEAAAPAPEETPAAEAPAAAEAASALLPHQAKLELDGSGTAWILTSTALVLMMTIPGLALFYGGMVRRKNVIATVAQSFAVTCVVTIVWMAITYSLAFGVNPDENLNKYVGSLDVLFLNGVTTETAFSAAKGLPEML